MIIFRMALENLMDRGGKEMRMKYTGICMVLFALAAVMAAGIIAAEAADFSKPTKCELTFNLKGWSAIYETMSGTGQIKCDNGQAAGVKLSVKGGGLTAGVSRIRGKGEFTEVYNLKELYGAYARGGAHAGVGPSAAAQVVTKGDISLALSATGKGVDLGISFGNFRIMPIGK
jgi:hypothetical protein